MLIDWITARLDTQYLTDLQVEYLKKIGDRVIRFNAETGNLVYETNAWDSIRSDSHNLTFRFSGDSLWIQGSPARVIGDGCAVFGNGASSKLDLRGSLMAMISFLSKKLSLILNMPLEAWRITRIDITDNLMLKDEVSVREALTILRDCEGGRYRVSQQAGDSVYWSKNSRIRKGKAYAKGAHLAYMMNKKDYKGRQYSKEEINSARKILRLELTLGAQFLREKITHWMDLTAFDLVTAHKKYFSRMIGSAEVKNETQLLKKLYETSPTKGQAQAAYLFFTFIKANSWQKAKDHFPKSSFYVHTNNLRKAGLGDSDISLGEVVNLREHILEYSSVNNWHDLMVA